MWLILSGADVAQLVEQLIRNQQVVGSSPTIGSNDYPNIPQYLLDFQHCIYRHMLIDFKKGFF
jgi:hypothetical protein